MIYMGLLKFIIILSYIKKKIQVVILVRDIMLHMSERKKHLH